MVTTRRDFITQVAETIRDLVLIHVANHVEGDVDSLHAFGGQARDDPELLGSTGRNRQTFMAPPRCAAKRAKGLAMKLR